MAICDTHDSSDSGKSAKHTFEFGAKMFGILEGKSIEIFPPFSVIGLILMMSLMMSFNSPIIILLQKTDFLSLFPSNSTRRHLRSVLGLVIFLKQHRINSIKNLFCKNIIFVRI